MISIFFTVRCEEFFKKMKYCLKLFLSVLFFMLMSCGSNLWDSADSSLSELGYTITIGTEEIGETYSFGTVRTSASTLAQTITLTNDSIDTFKIEEFYIVDPSVIWLDDDFGGVTLASGESVSSTISFSPESGGGYSATLHVDTNWSPAVDIGLSGSAVEGPIYVATGGDDESGLGTTDQPYATLKKGIEMAVDYETVYVAEGTYSSDETVYLSRPLWLKGGYKIDDEGNWYRETNSNGDDKLDQSSIINNTSSAAGTVTTLYVNAYLDTSTMPEDFQNILVEGFTILGPKMSLSLGGESRALGVESGFAFFVGNRIEGGTGLDVTGVSITSPEAPVILLHNIIFATADGAAYTESGYVRAVNVSNSYYPVLINNLISGGGGEYGSDGILVNSTEGCDIFSNIIFAGYGGSGSSTALSLNSVYESNSVTPIATTNVINNTVVTGFSAGNIYGMYIYYTPARVINNIVYNQPVGGGGASYGIYEGYNTTPYDVHSLYNNCVDPAFDTEYYDYTNGPQTDFTAVTVELAKLNNVLVTPVFAGTDNWRLGAASDVALRTGGLDLAGNAFYTHDATTSPYPPYIVYFNYTDLTGSSRSGDGSTGWSMGAFEY